MTQLAKKRLSKKKKGSWRKIEHEDVEEFLEDQRLEERIGKVSEKTDAELFEIDPKPASKKKSKKIGLTRLEKRKQLQNQDLKCFSGLINDSKVKDPNAKRNRVRSKEERKHFIAKSIEAANESKGIVKKKLLKSVADREKSFQKSAANAIKNKQKTFDKDIWEMGSLREQRTDLKNEWFERKIADHNIVNTGTPINKAHASAFHKRSKLNVIEIPHPGLSYNPTFEDHQDLLEMVKERELRLIKQEEHLNRVTTAMFKRIPATERDIRDLKERRAGLDDDENENSQVNENDDDESEIDLLSVNPPVENKKKLPKARNKQKQQKELQKQLLEKKMKKKQIADINRVKSLKKEIGVMEVKLDMKRESKKQREEQKRIEPHRLSKFAFEEEEIDIAMPEDISGNLRNLKPEGSLLKDRFKSLQKRNILPTSKDLGLRKRREVKRYVRNTHKVEPEQIQKKKKKRN